MESAKRAPQRTGLASSQWAPSDPDDNFFPPSTRDLTWIHSSDSDGSTASAQNVCTRSCQTASRLTDFSRKSSQRTLACQRSQLPAFQRASGSSGTGLPFSVARATSLGSSPWPDAGQAKRSKSNLAMLLRRSVMRQESPHQIRWYSQAGVQANSTPPV